MSVYVRVLEAPDGSQTLVTIYKSGTVELARRPNEHSSWGPPEVLRTVREETDNGEWTRGRTATSSGLLPNTALEDLRGEIG